jgi:hypothetical protein
MNVFQNIAVEQQELKQESIDIDIESRLEMRMSVSCSKGGMCNRIAILSRKQRTRIDAFSEST